MERMILAGLAPRRRLLVVGVLLLGVVLAAVLTVRACAGRGTPTGYPDQSRPGPVLLVPGRSLLRGLAGTPLPARLPWLSVWTEDDQTVQPPDSARLDGAVNVPVQSVCPDAHVEHGGLPTDPLVTGLVLRGIGTLPPAAPGPTDCAALRSAGAA